MKDSIEDRYSRAFPPGTGEPVWRPRLAPPQYRTPSQLKPWLDEPGSLTKRLRRYCHGRFGVRVLQEGWGMPALAESRILRLRTQNLGWVREVLLTCDGHACVFARTVMPIGILRGRYRCLRHLGPRPLGSLLFGRDTIRRGPLSMARLASGHRLFEQVRRVSETTDPLWARRSVFHVGDKPLLITEVFLPALPRQAREGRQ